MVLAPAEVDGWWREWSSLLLTALLESAAVARRARRVGHRDVAAGSLATVEAWLASGEQYMPTSLRAVLELGLGGSLGPHAATLSRDAATSMTAFYDVLDTRESNSDDRRVETLVAPLTSDATGSDIWGMVRGALARRESRRATSEPMVSPGNRASQLELDPEGRIVGVPREPHLVARVTGTQQAHQPVVLIGGESLACDRESASLSPERVVASAAVAEGRSLVNR